MLRPFQSFPGSTSPALQETLRAAALRAYTGAVAPAYRRLLEYLETRYIPRTRETIAARDLPDGEAWYDFSIRQMTTTNLTAQQIHDIGQDEVKRIRAEMDEVMERAEFDGTFQQFVGFMKALGGFVMAFFPLFLLGALFIVCLRSRQLRPFLIATGATVATAHRPAG